MIQWTVFLLPVAAAVGWFTGRREPADTMGTPRRLRNDYFKGLNYLINEQPDKAVDVFVKLLQVDSDTVETHLALGSLFRRRGEVDRAIRIHQNLIARPQLEKRYRTQALAALGQDYLSAGVLDRAEKLFLELASQGDENYQALKSLLRIYEQEKDWKNAISTVRKIEQISKQSMSEVIAQYYCEMAEEVFEKGWADQALAYLRKAQGIHHNCVRASILRGKIAAEAGDFEEAIRCYKYVRKQDSDFLSEVIDPIHYCFHALDDEKGWVEFLKLSLVDSPKIKIIQSMADCLRDSEGDQAAIQFMTEQIQKHPSMRGLNYLIGIYLSQSYGDTREKLSILQKFLDRLIAFKPVYCCEKCGFSAKSLLWLCPSCHQWETIKPIQGLEGV